MAITLRMRTIISPPAVAAMDSCFALIRAHQHNIAVWSMSGRTRVSKTLLRSILWPIIDPTLVIYFWKIGKFSRSQLGHQFLVAERTVKLRKQK